MNDFKEGYLLNRQEYGVLYPYVAAEEVRSFFWNGRVLMIQDEKQGNYVAGEQLSEGFLNRFAMLVCSRTEKDFGPEHPLLEFRGDEFYLEMIHGTYTTSGTVLFFQKHEKPVRPDAKELVEKGFCREEAIPILKQIIQEEGSFLIYGPKGSGMIPLLRFMSRYIPPEDRTISLEIEDRLALASVNPDKDILELKPRGRDMAGQLFRVCPGLNPRWIFGLINEGRLVNEWVRIAGGRSASNGMLVRVFEGEDVTERLYPWMDERNLGKMRITLIRFFPFWIGLDREGLKRIDRYERTGCVTLYHREKGEKGRKE